MAFSITGRRRPDWQTDRQNRYEWFHRQHESETAKTKACWWNFLDLYQNRKRAMFYHCMEREAAYV